MKSKCLLSLLVLFLLPAALAIESDTYFVTSEIYEDKVLEEIEIVGQAESMDSFELTLPLNIKTIQVLFNTNEINCDLQEELNHNYLTCEIEPYTGTYFIKVLYAHRPINLDGEILYRTIHEPYTKNFILIAKLSEDYRVASEDTSDLVSPAATSDYLEAGRQVFVWRLGNLNSFEASIIATEVSEFNYSWLWLILLVMVAALLIKHRKKKITPKFIEPEQKIVDALKGQKKPIKQKDLQRLTGFSKARLSRMLNNLENREVIQKKPWGRTNLIELKRK